MLSPRIFQKGASRKRVSQRRLKTRFMLNYDKIKKCAAEAGFTLCGVARARVLAEHRERFARNLSASGDRALPYLADRPERRFDPGHLVPGARTVIVCAVNYRNPYSGGYPAGFPNPKLCSYALSTEYQPKIKSMLAEMMRQLKEEHPGLSGRALSDTSAILEKAWAEEAGLGWIGKNSLLINPIYGSFLLLGELVVDMESDRYDEPFRGKGCGGCRRCMDCCPAGALPCPRTVDTGRCISALTIERVREPAPPELLHGWIYGCDECQNACPFNAGKPLCDNRAFDPVFDPSDFTRGRWAAMDEEEFHNLFAGTPLTRTGLARIKKMLPPGE